MRWPFSIVCSSEVPQIYCRKKGYFSYGSWAGTRHTGTKETNGSSPLTRHDKMVHHIIGILLRYCVHAWQELPECRRFEPTYTARTYRSTMATRRRAVFRSLFATSIHCYRDGTSDKGCKNLSMMAHSKNSLEMSSLLTGEERPQWHLIASASHSARGWSYHKGRHSFSLSWFVGSVFL